MNPDKVKYTIKQYDETRKLLVVQFDEAFWANIPLVMHVPQDAEELDKLVAKFAPRVEQVLLNEVDDSFVKSVVGTEREADRESYKMLAAQTAPPPAPASEGVALAEDSEREWVTSIVLEVLEQQGLIIGKDTP